MGDNCHRRQPVCISMTYVCLWLHHVYTHASKGFLTEFDAIAKLRY
jgi:hypothetical protein